MTKPPASGACPGYSRGTTGPGTCVHRPHAGYEHTHTEGCGHATVAHGDHVDYLQHVDYLHDGYVHHSHGDHYDEH
jgi:hypothetical protein